MIVFNKRALDWATHCFKSKDRFGVSVKFEDPYEFHKSELQVYNCIECNITFEMYKHFVKEDGADDWKYEDSIEIVNGVVLRAINFIDPSLEPSTIPSDSLRNKSFQVNYRSQITSNAAMDFAVDFWRNSLTILDPGQCKGASTVLNQTDGFRKPKP